MSWDGWTAYTATTAMLIGNAVIDEYSISRKRPNAAAGAVVEGNDRPPAVHILYRLSISPGRLTTGRTDQPRAR